MKITVTEYSTLPLDQNGNVLPMGGRTRASKKVVPDSDGVLHPIQNTRTLFLRIATDVTVHMAMGDDTVVATEDDAMLMAGSTEFFELGGASHVSFLLV